MQTTHRRSEMTYRILLSAGALFNGILAFSAITMINTAPIVGVVGIIWGVATIGMLLDP